jgi:hypothetical protein
MDWGTGGASVSQKDLSTIDSLFARSDLGESGKRFLTKSREGGELTGAATGAKTGEPLLASEQMGEAARSISLPHPDRAAGVVEKVLAWIRARKRAEAWRKRGGYVAEESFPTWGELAWQVLPTTPRTVFDWVALFFVAKILFMFYQLYRQYRIAISPVMVSQRKKRRRKAA